MILAISLFTGGAAITAVDIVTGKEKRRSRKAHAPLRNRV